MLYQLLSQVSSAGTDFQRLYEEKRKFYGVIGKDWEWKEVELRKVLQSTLITAARTHAIRIFLDALDEAGEILAQSIINYLYDVNEQLVKSEHVTSICISCRHCPIIRTNDGFQICVEDENKEDISTYVLAELRRRILGRGPELGLDDLNMLKTQILSKAWGVFLWVVLIIPVIAKQYNEGRALLEILEELEKAPSGLSETYEQILELVDSTVRNKTLHLMQRICLAERPLSLTELRFALASEDSSLHQFQESARESTGFVESDMRMKDVIIGLSGGLAEVKSHHDEYIFQFMHQSVNDFLIKEGFGMLDQSAAENAIGRGHDRLSKSCINYLKLGEVQSLTNSSSWNSLKVTANLPFVQYATTFWFLHAQKAESFNIPQHDLIGPFQWPSAKYFSHWIQIFREINRHNSLCPSMQMTLMQLAAASNLLSLVRTLLETETPLEQKDDEVNKVLHYAARWGHEKIVSTPLDANADINARNRAKRTPLELAAAGGHEAVIKLLPERGAEVNYQTGRTGNSLQSAALKGQLAGFGFLNQLHLDVKKIHK